MEKGGWKTELLILLRVGQILLIVVTCAFILVRKHSMCALCTVLRMTMAPHLGQETRKNKSSDYETASQAYTQNRHACLWNILINTLQHLNGKHMCTHVKYKGLPQLPLKHLIVEME